MISTKALWAGRIMKGLAIAFLTFDSVIHLIHPASIDAVFTQLGWSPDLSVTLGLILLVPLILYVIPRTSVFGAVLITGYLGGAIATNLRVGLPLFGNILFPVYVGIVVWGALYLLDERLRAVFPVKK